MDIYRLPKRLHPDFSRPGKKPSGSSEIDFSNPITKGLTEFYACQAGIQRRGFFNGMLTSADATFTYPSIKLNGPELHFDDTVASSQLNVSSGVPASSAVTVLMCFYTEITLVSDTRFFLNNTNKGRGAT